MDLDREALLKSFLVESTEELDLVEQALVALESQPSDQEALGSIFRAVHTIKGNAYSLGFERLGVFAHACEDLLTRLRDGAVEATPGIVTLLLRAVDALRQTLAACVAGVERPLAEHAALLERLKEGAPIGRLTVETSGALPARAPGRRREDIQAFVDRDRTLRVDVSRLDRMLDLTGEIAIARGRLRETVEASRSEPASEALQDVERLFADLQELVMKLRMVPVGPVFRQYVRVARDLAVAHGKQVRLSLVGEDVEVDMTVIEHLKDPLTHMVRNALDHGIEPPAARRAAGKDPHGTLTLRARHEAGSILIEVEDDGAGLDRPAILKTALERGLVQDSRLSEAEIDRLIFEPGFSTSEGVSELSGRGVGMDVVRSNVEALHGSVAIRTRPGQGTALSLRFPLTLAIVDGFGFGVGGEAYIVPLDAVIECLEFEPALVPDGNGHGVLDLRGEPLPYVTLREHFGLGGVPPGRQQVVVARHTGGQVGLVVDQLQGESQTVVKPLGTLFRGIPGIAGSAILGSGRVALILDVEGMLRSVLAERAAPEVQQDAREEVAVIGTEGGGSC